MMITRGARVPLLFIIGEVSVVVYRKMIEPPTNILALQILFKNDAYVLMSLAAFVGSVTSADWWRHDTTHDMSRASI